MLISLIRAVILYLALILVVSRYVDGKDWLQKRLSKKTEADTSETR